MKNKVRLVLDFREVNVHMACHTHGDTIDICLETVRQWRQMMVVGGTKTIVNLKSAYLHLVEKLAISVGEIQRMHILYKALHLKSWQLCLKSCWEEVKVI